LVEAVKTAMELAEQQFTGAEGAKKREFVKGRVKDAAKKLDLKQLPSWLEEPIRDAVVSVIIEVCWNLVFKGKQKA
jgi:ppGpp synthetase/RelA/SpoT-type nucleotidyltranferase